MPRRSRGLLIAICLIALTPVGATTDDGIVNEVLRARLVFGDVFWRAAEHHVNVVHLVRTRRVIAARLGPRPAPHLKTFTIERTREYEVRRTIGPEVDVTEITDRFNQIITNFGPDQARARALERIQTLSPLVQTEASPNLELRRSLVDFIRFALWSQTNVPAVDQPSVDNLEFFGHAAAFEVRWQRLMVDVGLNERRRRLVANGLAKVRDEVARGVLARRFETRTLRRGFIQLHELPPELAVFKGLPANECSSRECTGYPLARFERTFLVTNELGQVDGIVAVTQVAEGYYVNTISGRHINAEKVRLILSGLNQIGGPILLPTRERIKSNFNQIVVREVLLDLIERYGAQPITYLDAADRDQIERFAFRPFDRMARNALAHPIDGSEFESDLTVTVSPRSAYANWSEAPIPRDAKVVAMLEAIASGRLDVAREFWIAAGHTAREATELIARVNNTRAERAEAFRSRALDMLLRSGIDPANAAALFDRGSLFQFGRLITPERLEPSCIEQTLDAMITHLFTNPTHVYYPEFCRWFAQLSKTDRETFLLIFLRHHQSTFASPGDDDADQSLLHLLIKPEDLIERTDQLIRAGFSRPYLYRLVREIEPSNPDAASDQIWARAFAAAQTAADFVAVAKTDLGHPSIDATTRARVVGRNIAHFLSLRPSFADIKTLAKVTQLDGLLTRLDVSSSLRRVTSVQRFARDLERLGPQTSAVNHAFLHAAASAQLPRFLKLNPPVEYVRRVRNAALAPDSIEDMAVVQSAVASLDDPKDLVHIARDKDAHDRTLVRAALDRSEWLVAHLQTLTPAEEDAFFKSTALAPLRAYLRRHFTLLVTRDPVQFLDQLPSFGMNIVGAAKNAPLTPAEVAHLLALNPTMHQFLDLLAWSGDVVGNIKRARPVIRTVADLRELLDVIRWHDQPVSALRREFSGLLQSIIEGEDINLFKTETELDRLTLDFGLDINRHTLSPIDDECAWGLEHASPSDQS